MSDLAIPLVLAAAAAIVRIKKPFEKSWFSHRGGGPPSDDNVFISTYEEPETLEYLKLKTVHELAVFKHRCMNDKPPLSTTQLKRATSTKDIDSVIKSIKKRIKKFDDSFLELRLREAIRLRDDPEHRLLYPIIFPVLYNIGIKRSCKNPSKVVTRVIFDMKDFVSNTTWYMKRLYIEYLTIMTTSLTLAISKRMTQLSDDVYELMQTLLDLMIAKKKELLAGRKVRKEPIATHVIPSSSKYRTFLKFRETDIIKISVNPYNYTQADFDAGEYSRFRKKIVDHYLTQVHSFKEKVRCDLTQCGKGVYLDDVTKTLYKKISSICQVRSSVDDIGLKDLVLQFYMMIKDSYLRFLLKQIIAILEEKSWDSPKALVNVMLDTLVDGDDFAKYVAFLTKQNMFAEVDAILYARACTLALDADFAIPLYTQEFVIDELIKAYNKCGRIHFAVKTNSPPIKLDSLHSTYGDWMYPSRPDGDYDVRYYEGGGVVNYIHMSDDSIHELRAVECDARMLPVQTTGTCYLHCALNMILNTKFVLNYSIRHLKKRIDSNPYSSTLGGRHKRGFKAELALTNTNIRTMGEFSIDPLTQKQAEESVSEILRNISKMDDDLKQWTQDTILHTILRRAAIEPLEKVGFKDQPSRTQLDDAMYTAVLHRPNASGDLKRSSNSKTASDIWNAPIHTYAEFGSGGAQMDTFFEILDKVGLKRFNKNSFERNGPSIIHTYIGDMVASGLIECTNDTFKSLLASSNGWDKTGGIRIGYTDEKGRYRGHAVMYRRHGANVYILDSHWRSQIPLDEYYNAKVQSGWNFLNIYPLFTSMVLEQGGGSDEDHVEVGDDTDKVDLGLLANIVDVSSLDDIEDADYKLALDLMQSELHTEDMERRSSAYIETSVDDGTTSDEDLDNGNDTFEGMYEDDQQ